MPRHSNLVFPKTLFASVLQSKPSIQVSQQLVDSAVLQREEVFRKFETCREGLTTEVAAVRRTQLGPNILAKDQRVAWTTLIWHSVLNPLVILLAVLAAISFATGDARAGTVMTVMIALGVGLKLVQEAKADSAMASR